MKKSILFLAGFCLLFNSAIGQAPSAAFAPIKDHLERWDDIRGAWLAAAIQALAANKQVPDRTFPEDFTPYEMLSMIPAKERQDLRQMVLENQRVATTSSNSTTDIGLFSSMLEHSFCSRTFGRSYGDPHLKSYDRATYSFQTVGEFVLSKSTNGLFEVQTRQRAQDDNFSLNAAVAMNVAGDRLCFYAGDKPDDIQQTPLRLNGQAIQNKTPYEINRMGLSRSFQITNIFPKLSVFENLRCAVLWSLGYKYSFWKFLSGLKDANERTDELLDMIHLDKKRDVLAVNLTYAEQRALEIGVTIAGGSDVILLDEPTAGMSKSETSRFIQLIKDVTVGKTLLTVEHDMGVVFGLADKIAVVVYGEVIAFDSPEAVRANAKVQEAYLGSPVADSQAGGH